MTPFDPSVICRDALLSRLIDEVRELNGGDLNDDIAILGPCAGRSSSTTAAD